MIRTIKRLVLAGVAAATLTAVVFTGPASAQVLYDSASGTGFVGKGDVQQVFGWNNPRTSTSSISASLAYENRKVNQVSGIFLNGFIGEPVIDGIVPPPRASRWSTRTTPTPTARPPTTSRRTSGRPARVRRNCTCPTRRSASARWPSRPRSPSADRRPLTEQLNPHGFPLRGGPCVFPNLTAAADRVAG